MLRLPARDTESETMTFSCVHSWKKFELEPKTLVMQPGFAIILSQVLNYTLESWPRSPNQSQSELKPFFNQKEHLSVEQNCILLGYRVINPTKFWERLLNELQVITQACAHWSPRHVYEMKVKLCTICRAVQNAPPCAPLLPWQFPSKIWQRLHINFTQKGRTTFFIVIDSYSKWLEAFDMRRTTAEITCITLWTLFVSYGLPEKIVSDKGPRLTSAVFKEFLKSNGVKKTLTPPYHLQLNGQSRFWKEAWRSKYYSLGWYTCSIT